MLITVKGAEKEIMAWRIYQMAVAKFGEDITSIMGSVYGAALWSQVRSEVNQIKHEGRAPIEMDTERTIEALRQLLMMLRRDAPLESLKAAFNRGIYVEPKNDDPRKRRNTFSSGPDATK